MKKTLLDKIWEKHVVTSINETTNLLYIDFHLMHEVTSTHAFNSLKNRNRTVKRPELILATMDHQTPTKDIEHVEAEVAVIQMEALKRNAETFQINKMYPLGHQRQGIIHAIGPELGVIHPGMTVVCGDSHTSTHGAFGALAFGIGISEVSHVLETQCLIQAKPKSMAVTVNGALNPGVTAKDVILHILGTLGTDGGVGHVIEYRGDVIDNMSMEGRMTICNMTIEGGARAGMIAPDDKTFAYLKGRPHVPHGEQWERAIEYWRQYHTDEGASFDKEIVIDGNDIKECITWGTTPAQVVNIDGDVPQPKNKNEKQALAYMGLAAGQKIEEIPIDAVFIGSCTNARIEDLRTAASVVQGRHANKQVKALVVPGTMQIRQQAEEEGLAQIFIDAGFEWRYPGCSMCVGMNDDTLGEYQRSASTSNRNFEGRQGKNVRTHLVSPAIAAASAIAGHFASPSAL